MVVRKCRIFRDFLRFSLNICRFSSTFTGEAHDILGVASSHFSNQETGPLKTYDEMVKNGKLRLDKYQRSIVEQLQRLYNDVVNYQPDNTGFLRKIFKMGSKQQVPSGLYLYGSVGCGKTMLMDMFYNEVPVEKKQRVHFHSFMLDVHASIHKLKSSLPPRDPKSVRAQPFDPIPPVSEQISSKWWLLCFDEFQVTDIADAMILKRLFTALFEQGVVVIATSNRHPDDLYKNGLQRSNFLPFIPILKKHCKVICLDSGIDYRKTDMSFIGKLYFSSLGPATDSELDWIFFTLAQQQKEENADCNPGPTEITVLGSRKLFAPHTCGRMADFTFEQLCARPLGAADYLALSENFDVIILRNIPKMTVFQKTEARRFITLIDALYDNRTRLICSASTSIEDLFLATPLSTNDDEFKRKLMDDLDLTAADASSSAIFTAEEEIFAFERTISRLTEMQTEQYWSWQGFRKSWDVFRS
ncbi:AFG1-like ATPase [Montipora foliosa]|uniref:AFG1-like ATPase n=1 Tax=Montipora foliosa TaxID=591990 RepID=UPI0035F1C8F9